MRTRLLALLAACVFAVGFCVMPAWTEDGDDDSSSSESASHDDDSSSHDGDDDDSSSHE